MKYFYLVLITVLSSYSAFCQELTGNVKDSLNNPISFATVQLLSADFIKIISFTQSDTNGDFILNLKEQSFPLKIKVSHISYETFEKKITSNEFLQIKLNSRVNKLEDIIVEGSVFDVQEKNDSLIYNLDKLLNGSELLLKDIIEKLPGLSIDANGKIRYNGTLIDHLLINGDEFFRENHQIATENLTPEMIKKIALLKNYQDFSSVKGFENNGKNALNIDLKDEFKEQYKGIATAETGVKERYNLNNYLYNFGSESKFNLLMNSNNLNQTIFSITDYLSMRNVTGKKAIEEQFSSGSYSSTEKDLPPFLFSKDNVNTKDIQNATLNYSKKINHKERIEFISIFNNTHQTEKNESLLTFFDNTNSDAINTESLRGGSFFNSNVFKYENKFSNKTYLKLNAYLFNSDDNQYQNIFNSIIANQTENNFYNNTKLNSTKFGLNAYLKNKLSSKILLESTIFYDFNATNSTKNFDSNLIFDWFNYNEKNFKQDNKINWMTFGLQTKATYKLKKGQISAQFLSSNENETYKNQNTIGQHYNFTDSFYKTENNLGIKYFTYFFKDKIIFTSELNYSNNKYTISYKFNEQINYILPSVSLTYLMLKNLSISSSYKASKNDFSILNFLSNDLIENYRTRIIANNLFPEKNITDTYSLSLSYNNIRKNIYTSLSVSNNLRLKFIGQIHNNNAFVTNQQFSYLENQESNSLIYNFEKKFNSIPYSLKLSTINTNVKNNSFINSEKSVNNIFQNQINFGLKSYFKKSYFNFNLGIDYLSSKTKNQTLTSEYNGKLLNISPFLTLNGLILNKKINWSIKSNYYVFNSSLIANNEILDVGFNINYNFNKNVRFNIHANNILNIRENNTKNSILLNQFMFQENSMNTLSGFINLGFSYSY